jgi:hypothetical protein
MNMAVRVLGEDRAGQLYDLARGLDGIDDMGQLMELVSPEQ